MLNKLFSLFSQDIAIDLGTATTLVYVRGRGIVIFEPSVVAINQKTGQILAIGSEAKKMVGRTPAHIVATRPLVKGVISDFEVTEQMLKYFIEKVQKRKFLFTPRPRVIIGVPCGVTEVEKKSVRDAALSAGAREVHLIEQPMAAAIGARLPVQEAGGNLIVDIGGGTAQVVIISLGGIVLAKSLKETEANPEESEEIEIMQMSEKEIDEEPFIKFKQISDFQSFFRVNINHFSFWIIKIANRCPAGPNTVSDFLPQTSFGVF